jgi:UPF0755 protein
MKKSSGKIAIISMCAISLLFTLMAAGFALNLYLSSPLTSEEKAYSERIEIPSGTSVHTVASRLAEKKLIRSAGLMYLTARYPSVFLRKKSFALKSGVYTVSSAMTLHEIMDLLESGKQEYIKTVIPEGLTLTKIAEELEEKGVCEAEAFISAAKDTKLLSSYGIPADSFEGYLFPETYFFTPGMQAENVVSMMADTFFERVKGLSISPLYTKGGNLTPAELHKIVTLASIVEREYRVDSEAPLIASVFTNRIKAKSGLYSCATIEYIITEILGRPHPEVITYEDLKLDSPYNTYRWAGLTPGPISNPGMIALQAAANPPETNYFYFTLNDAAAGTHTFTESIDSHAKASIQYRTKKAAVKK